MVASSSDMRTLDIIASLSQVKEDISGLLGRSMIHEDTMVPSIGWAINVWSRYLNNNLSAAFVKEKAGRKTGFLERFKSKLELVTVW